MSTGGLGDSASKARNRPIFERWFGSGFIEDDSKLYFADTEMAAINSVMEAIEQTESSYIYDPLPTNDVPLAICLAYLRSQDTRFPTDGVVGAGKSLMALPALSQGYVTRFDELREDGIGRNPRLLDRQCIQRLSQVHDDDFYTAKHGFEFDQSWPNDRIGAIFIDLRKAEWREPSRRLETIIDLLDEDTPPIIFYTDTNRGVFDPIQDQSNNFAITSELLTTASPGSTAKATTMAAGYERLLATSDLSVSCISFGYPDNGKAINKLREMKNKLQERGLAPMEVGWVYNLLTKLPVKPEHWADAVTGDFYQSTVKDLVQGLRGIAQRANGQTAELLINYVQGINHLQGILNKEHPVQQALFEAIEKAELEGINRTIVVKDDHEHQALLHAINMENETMPENYASIQTLDDIEPATSGETVYARPFEYNSHPYQFPLCSDITTYQFVTWGPTVLGQIKSGLDNTNATFETQVIGETKSQGSSSGEGNTDTRRKYQRNQQNGRSRGSSKSQVTGSKVRVELSNGDVRTVGLHSKFPVYNDSGEIARVRVEDLDVGDDILLLSTATDDIYEMYLDSAKEQDKIRKCGRTVQQWRDVLQSNITDGDTSYSDALRMIRAAGSDVTSKITVRLWTNGRTIGPSDDKDVSRVLEVFQPELKPRAPAIVQSMKQIRRIHQKIGQRARRAVEAEMCVGSEHKSTSDDLDSIDGVEEDITQVSIEAMEKLSNE